MSDIETNGCIISVTLASVYVKLGDEGDTGIEGEDQLGTPSVASLVNSCELVWNITAFLKSESSSTSG